MRVLKILMRIKQFLLSTRQTNSLMVKVFSPLRPQAPAEEKAAALLNKENAVAKGKSGPHGRQVCRLPEGRNSARGTTGYFQRSSLKDRSAQQRGRKRSVGMTVDPNVAVNPLPTEERSSCVLAQDEWLWTSD